MTTEACTPRARAPQEKSCRKEHPENHREKASSVTTKKACTKAVKKTQGQPEKQTKLRIHILPILDPNQNKQPPNSVFQEENLLHSEERHHSELLTIFTNTCSDIP